MNIRTVGVAAACALLLAAAPARTPAAGVNSPGVPAALETPQGQILMLNARGTGVQIYTCTADAERFVWTFKAPEAQLRDVAGRIVGRHYSGPTWESADGSKVIGEVVAKSAAPGDEAIPWLLLRAKAASGSGLFGGVKSIQRVHTVGGKPPTDGCQAAQAGTETRVPYSADYLFYGAGPSDADSPRASASPVGVWKTFDDRTGKARALVRIFAQNGELFGRIEQTFTPGGEHRVCVPCTDERKNQPIIGLLVMRNMKSRAEGYEGGDILDPESGSVYRCKMHLEQNGSRLVLRGYIGISLLGRSQTWQRQD